MRVVVTTLTTTTTTTAVLHASQRRRFEPHRRTHGVRLCQQQRASSDAPLVARRRLGNVSQVPRDQDVLPWGLHLGRGNPDHEQGVHAVPGQDLFNGGESGG